MGCPDVNGKIATGWQGHMLQDCSKDFSKWLASKPDAMRLARAAVAENQMEQACKFTKQTGIAR